MVVQAWLARAARTRPNAVAIETPDGGCTYAELMTSASYGAHALAERGVCRGDRVAIALAPGLDFAGALHACMLLGAVAVPIDLRLSAAEREAIAHGAALALDRPLPRSAPGEPQAGVTPHHAPDAPAIVIHTSGTSAAPKPVALTYGNLLWSALGSAVALGLDADERWLCTLPLSHVGGLSILVRSAIYGTTAIVHERFDTDRVVHALREERVTLVSLVATTLGRLLDAGLQDPPAAGRCRPRSCVARRPQACP
jgi:o-succinylbenzoate---CoA ligase